MPELPEAETIVRGLRPVLVGRSIARTEVLRPDVLRVTPRRLASGLRGREILEVGRRGKNVVLRLTADHRLVVNLGMTGRLLPSTGGLVNESASRHPAVRFRLDDGETLVFDDTRRFGTVECLSPTEWAARSDRMGPEPLDEAFTSRDLWDGLRVSRTPVRSWLLDQRRIAGVGNIYANEALFLAGVHPQRSAKAVREREAQALHRGLRRVLRRAIDAGGTTLKDYRDAGGNEGRYARRLLVYGRQDEPCTRCSEKVVRVVFGGRSAFYCPACQPPRGTRP